MGKGLSLCRSVELPSVTAVTSAGPRGNPAECHLSRNECYALAHAAALRNAAIGFARPSYGIREREEQ